MRKDYHIISFEVSKLLKKINFPQDLPNTGWYNRLGKHLGYTRVNEKGEHITDKPSIYNPAIVDPDECKIADKLVFSAPSTSIVLDYIRTNYHIDVVIIPLQYRKYIYKIFKHDLDNTKLDVIEYSKTSYNDYHETLNQGLLFTLNYI